MFDAFLRLFLIWFLNRLFHIRIALGLLFLKHTPIQLLDTIFCSKKWFFVICFRAFWNSLLCMMGILSRGGGCGCCRNWYVTSDTQHLTYDMWFFFFLNKWILFATFHYSLKLLLTFFLPFATFNYVFFLLFVSFGFYYLLFATFGYF